MGFWEQGSRRLGALPGQLTGDGLPRSLRATLALAVVICAGMALPAVAAAATASLEGVVESASGQKLEGAEVCALEEGEEEPQSARCVSTSSSGAYTLTINAGSYYVEFYTGQESGLNYVTQYYDGVDSLSEATKVTLAAGEKRTIDPKLQPAGAISGVVQAAGRGVNFSFVCALEVGSGKSSLVGCEETGSNGEFTISKLASGHYEIAVLTFEGGYISPQYFSESDSEAFALHEGEEITVAAGNTVTLKPMELHQGGKISGTVSNASIEKQPIAGVEVCASPTGGAESGNCGATNAAGEYTIEGLASAPTRSSSTAKSALWPVDRIPAQRAMAISSTTRSRPKPKPAS